MADWCELAYRQVPKYSSRSVGCFPESLKSLSLIHIYCANARWQVQKVVICRNWPESWLLRPLLDGVSVADQYQTGCLERFQPWFRLGVNSGSFLIRGPVSMC